jgi:hypothetical protein
MTDYPSDGHDFVAACGKFFKHLHVTRLLQHVPLQALHELTQRLGFQGGASSFYLTADQTTTILEVCLLHTPPFRDTEPDQLHDTRRPAPHGRRFHTCVDRGRLIVMLADDLLEYQFECDVHYAAWRHAHSQAVNDREGLQRAVEVFLTLRERGLHPASPTLRRLRRKRVLSALDTLTRLVDALTLEDYSRVDHPYPLLSREAYDYILSSMVEHVREFGPPKFSRARTYHLLAEILVQFGLEHGGVRQVAFRLQKRLSARGG